MHVFYDLKCVYIIDTLAEHHREDWTSIVSSIWRTCVFDKKECKCAPTFSVISYIQITAYTYIWQSFADRSLTKMSAFHQRSSSSRSQITNVLSIAVCKTYFIQDIYSFFSNSLQEHTNQTVYTYIVKYLVTVHEKT